MPAYDYRCIACDISFEVTRPVSQAKVPASCPACGASATRVFTPVGVVFKGSGFHNTDYKTRPDETKPAECPPSGSESSACSSCPASTGSDDS